MVAHIADRGGIVEARHWEPGSYLLVGLAALAGAGLVMLGGLIFPEAMGLVAVLAGIVATFGTVILSIGIIAKGVQVGRHHP